jgi:hypothetical protein
MTITVEIRPEVQAELARQAAAQGALSKLMLQACSKTPRMFLRNGCRATYSRTKNLARQRPSI